MAVLKVSWIMPVHNQAAFVGAALASIQEQSIEDCEIIVIDDGSCDGTAEVIRSFRDPRLRLFSSGGNFGVSRALNIGLRAARGEYIARMDGDDLSTPDRLELQVAFMDNNPALAVCGSHVETFGAASQVVRRPLGSASIKCFLLAAPPFSHPSVMLRRSVLQRHALYYDENIGAAQDYEFWFRLLQIAPGGNVDAVLLKHRLHGGQVSKGRGDEQEANAARVRGEVLRLLGITTDTATMERHTALFRDTLHADRDHLEWATSWLERIYQGNRSAGVFEEPALVAFLNRTLQQYCSRCAACGITPTKVSVGPGQGLLSRLFNKISCIGSH